MRSAEQIEKASPGFQALNPDQQTVSRAIAYFLLEGLEDSSVTEGFTPQEMQELRETITVYHFRGEIGKRIGEVSPEEAQTLSPDPKTQ